MFIDILCAISGDWIDDEDQIIRLKCSYVISAFGSTLSERPGKLSLFLLHSIFYLSTVIDAMAPLSLDKYNYPVVDLANMSTTEPGVFCGGDLAKVASTTVESVNDGKTAAWHIHRFLQVSTVDQLTPSRCESDH